MMTEEEIKSMKYDVLKKYATDVLNIDMPQSIKKKDLQALVLDAWAKENMGSEEEPVVEMEEVDSPAYVEFEKWSTSRMWTEWEIRSKAAEMGINLKDYGAWRRKKLH